MKFLSDHLITVLMEEVCDVSRLIKLSKMIGGYLNDLEQAAAVRSKVLLEVFQWHSEVTSMFYPSAARFECMVMRYCSVLKCYLNLFG